MQISFQGHKISALALTIGLICSASARSADVKANLTGAQETPPVTTSASGVAMIGVAADKSVTGSIKTKSLDGTAAHIHLGAAGKSGPPIITLTKTADGVWNVPPDSKLTDEQLASFKAGELYVNVHSAMHQPGEIRAQLKP